MKIQWISIGLLAAILLTGCSATTAEASSSDAVITEAVQTSQAWAAETVTALQIHPSATLAPSATPFSTVTPAVTLKAAVAPVTFTQPSAASVRSSCDVAGFVSDVTIPDGTVLDASETFTKTWELRNDGTCTWSTSYLLVFYSGNSMSGPATQQLSSASVAPGGVVDISVSLTAPETAGTYTGYWILRNASGANFGLGSGGSPFYVNISVGSTATPTATSAETATPTSTTEVTSTPEPTSTPVPTETPVPTVTPESVTATDGS